MSSSPIMTSSGKDNYWTTGSGDDVIIPIIYVEGVQANKDYGVEIYNAGQCPGCHFPQSITLSFNPGDAHYYYYCFNCQKWYRYLNPNGSLSDFQVVVSGKKTPVDQNIFLYNELDYFNTNGW